jgi:hypothetical protein
MRRRIHACILLLEYGITVTQYKSAAGIIWRRRLFIDTKRKLNVGWWCSWRMRREREREREREVLLKSRRD